VVLTVILGFLCASFMNAGSNAIDQIYDLEIDRLNKPNRPLVTGALSMREAWVFSWILYALALIPTWLVVPYPYDTWGQKLTAPLGGHVTFFIYLAGFLFTFVYSAPELGRTKIRGMLANFTIAIPRGVLLKVAGWAMVAHVAFTEPWYIGGVIGLFLLGAASTKDFADMEGDRAGGCKTLPLLYGVRKAAWMISPFFILPCGSSSPSEPTSPTPRTPRTPSSPATRTSSPPSERSSPSGAPTRSTCCCEIRIPSRPRRTTRRGSTCI
jgi:4-hydroxybenzoate polyprenyltransferase